MFAIKVCGIMHPEDARMVAEAGADAIGLNFYPKSKRYVSIAQAAAIAAETPSDVCKVGLFVNAELATIQNAVNQVGLDAIQLHGDEPPSFLQKLPECEIIRAIRCPVDGISEVINYLDQCEAAGRIPQSLLLDAHQPGQYGGTGVTADWDQIRSERSQLRKVPLILAGGLTPRNVGEAIEKVQPEGVDTASGVETSPGQKDAQLVADFVAVAKQGFQRLRHR